MTTRRILAVAALVPLVASVAAAEAAPRRKPKPKPIPKVCNLVKDDATNDGTGIGNGFPAVAPNDPTLDVLSADVASNATTLTAVIRLASVDFAPTQGSAQTGHAYDVTFMARGTAVVVRGVIAPTGESWAGGKGKGTVDKVKKEVRIHVPIASLAVPFKPNEKLTELRATSWRWVGSVGEVTLGLVDRANGVAPYTASAPSCVTVGV